MAALECRSLHQDAHLLVVNNATEQSAVAEMLDSINGQCQSNAFFVSSFQIWRKPFSLRTNLLHSVQYSGLGLL